MKNQDLSNSKKLLSISEAAAILGICIKMVRNLIHARKITFVKVGNRYKFEPCDIEKYIEKNKIKAVQ